MKKTKETKTQVQKRTHKLNTQSRSLKKKERKKGGGDPLNLTALGL